MTSRYRLNLLISGFQRNPKWLASDYSPANA
jgi:hypothetical protein